MQLVTLTWLYHEKDGQRLLPIAEELYKQDSKLTFLYFLAAAHELNGEPERAIDIFIAADQYDLTEEGILTEVLRLGRKSENEKAIAKVIHYGMTWLSEQTASSVDERILRDLMVLCGRITITPDRLQDMIQLAETYSFYPNLVMMIARTLYHGGHPDEAERVVYSGYFVAQGAILKRLYLAGLLAAKGETDQAIQIVNQYVNAARFKAEKDSVLGHILVWNGRVAQGIVHLKRALNSDPGQISALCDLAFCAELRREYTLALSLMEQAARHLETKDIRRILGLNLMTRNRLRRRIIFVAQMTGAKDLALGYQEEYSRQDPLYKPEHAIEWTGESFHGKEVIVLAELGVGDEIRYASVYSRYFKGTKSVTLTCDPRLESLLTRSFPQYRILPVQRTFPGFRTVQDDDRSKVLSQRMRKIANNKTIEVGEAADIWVRAINLFERDAIERHKIRYSARKTTLKTDPRRRAATRTHLQLNSNGLTTIGISWRGGQRSYSRDAHYYDVEHLQPILDNQAYCFVNLQYGATEAETTYLKNILGSRFVDFPELDLYDDFEGIAALCRELDIVVAVSTAVLELAGAVGTKALYLMRSPQVTHAIRIGGHQDEYGCYPDSVWPACTVYPRFDMVDKDYIKQLNEVLIKLTRLK